MPRVSLPTNGPAIRVIRERSGLSISDVVAQLRVEYELDVHENHLRNIETGRRRAGPQIARAIAAILRVPIVAILTDPNYSDLIGARR